MVHDFGVSFMLGQFFRKAQPSRNTYTIHYYTVFQELMMCNGMIMVNAYYSDHMFNGKSW